MRRPRSSGPFPPSSPCSTTSPSSPTPGGRNDPTETPRGTPAKAGSPTRTPTTSTSSTTALMDGKTRSADVDSGCGARAGREVVVRALEPVRRMRFRITGGPAGDVVSVRYGGGRRGGGAGRRNAGAGRRGAGRGLSLLRQLSARDLAPVENRPHRGRVRPPLPRGLRRDRTRRRAATMRSRRR